MKKILLLLLIAFVVSICCVSCVRQTVDPAVSSVAPPSPVENGSDAIVEQGSDSHFEINEPTEVIPDDNGEHDWSLVSFVTEESEIPFAGVFVCKDCKVQTQKSIIFKDIDIPLVSVSGDLTEISKENKVKAAIRFSSNETSFFCAATMKWQGDGSLAHPKKNYSVALYDDAFNKKKKVEVNKEWGAESKYCLKANYAEPTFVRNLVLSDLYGLIAHDADYVDEYSELINGGAIDGFPILLYINGQYEGVYNWNIPKDKWLLGMGDDKDAGEAILCGSATQLNDRVEGITVDESIKGYWEIEYCNKAFRGNNGTDWAVDSFNEMLAFVKNADKETMRARASEFLNVDRALDVLLMSLVLAGPDNIVKNMLWATYDGTTWAPILYDLDRTLGRHGNELISTDYFEDFKGHPLYLGLFVAFFDELKERYFALRETYLNKETVFALFSQNMVGMDDRYFRSEEEKWPNAIWHQTTDEVPIASFADELDYVADYTEKRLAYCDKIFSSEELTFNEWGYLDWEDEK